MLTRLLALILAASFTVPASAETTMTGRYQLLAVSGGFVRLDTQTGAMTYCRDEVSAFECSLVNQESGQQALKYPDMKKSERLANSDIRDFEKALSIVEKAFRSFMAIAKEEKSKDCTF